jgi:hypothetical protein
LIAIIDQYAFESNVGKLENELRFNGLACRTNRGYPSEAELKSASILMSCLLIQTGLPS